MSSLEDVVRALVRDEVSRAIAVALDGAGVAYSTEPGSWPPRCRSRRAARERIRLVPGHERVGRGRATVWRVSRAAYDAHNVRSRARAAARPATAPALLATSADHEIALRALGRRSA